MDSRNLFQNQLHMHEVILQPIMDSLFFTIDVCKISTGSVGAGLSGLQHREHLPDPVMDDNGVPGPWH